jgi:hypothetical protein
VLVLPSRIKKAELREVRYLLRVTAFPLIGVIAYPPRRFPARKGRGYVPAVARAESTS